MDQNNVFDKVWTIPKPIKIPINVKNTQISKPKHEHSIGNNKHSVKIYKKKTF